MNVRVFFMLIVSMTCFVMSFEFGAAPTVQLSHSSPSVPVEDYDERKELESLVCACPKMDPCFLGNYFMELFDLMRKCFNNCTLQPRRCMMIIFEEDRQNHKEYLQLKKKNLTCYLESSIYDKDDLRLKIKLLRTLECEPKSPKLVVSGVTNVTNTTIAPLLANVTVSTAVNAKVVATAQ